MCSKDRNTLKVPTMKVLYILISAINNTGIEDILLKIYYPDNKTLTNNYPIW